MEIGTSSFKIMIDQDKVFNYASKEGLDKKESYVVGDISSPVYNPRDSIMGTPVINTPLPFDKSGMTPRSVRGWDSPSFQTPAHSRDMQFTPYHQSDNMPMKSPTTTPLNIGGGGYQNTPMHYISSTPKYNLGGGSMASPIGSSYYGRFQHMGSDARSPYPMGSASPDYMGGSSSGMSGPSPSYQNYSPSPYSSSPNYSQESLRNPNANNRKDEEDDPADEQDF